MSHTTTTPADLHERIRALEQERDAQEREIGRLHEHVALLQAVLDQVPYAIYWKDTRLVYQGCNRRFAEDVGLPGPAAIVGKTDADLPWQEAERAAFEAAERQLLAAEAPIYDDDETVIHPDGRQEWFETYKLPLHDASGALVGLLATYNNITARKRAEATVQAQAALLEEVSTPVIPLTDEILVLPLVGAVDTHRAQQVIETVLGQVAASGAQLLLLDITGVPIIDTQVAHALIQTAHALRLLGARLVLTGIRPEVAQALVGLGVELGDMVTFSTLERGLAHAFTLQAAGGRGASGRLQRRG